MFISVNTPISTNPYLTLYWQTLNAHRVEIMVSLIAQYRDELQELCRRYHVRRLELFGSAASGEFNPESSDLDFLLMFEKLEPATYADAYLGFYEDLTALFDRRIELVSSTAITNPFFLESIQRNRETLYAA